MNDCLMLDVSSENQVSYSQSLANWAKTEVLKDLVKKKVKEKYGGKLEKLADDLVEILVESEKSDKKSKSLMEKTDKELIGFY